MNLISYSWEQRKVNDLMDVGSVKRIHQSDWTQSGIRFLRARDIVANHNGENVEDPLFISKEKYDEYSLISGKVKKGDLLVTGVGTIGIPMLISNEKPIYFKDGNVIWLKNNNSTDGKFLFFSYDSKTVKSFISDEAGIGTVGTYTIDSCKRTPLNLPNIEEQKKIGTLFEQLDSLITLHQRKLIFLKSHRFLMSVLFCYSWEQRKLKELCTYESSNITSQDISSIGKYELFDANGSIGRTDKYIIGKEYISIIKDGAGVGRIRKLPKNTAILGTMGAIKAEYCEYNFLFSLLEKANLGASFSGSTIPHIYFKDYGENYYFVPSALEQNNIGELFNDLDHLITLHQRKQL